MAESGKRPFWMHQLVEYILGGAMAYSGLMSPTPIVPAVCGGLIILNAALTKGAIGAFRAYGRNVHRIFDIAIIMICLASIGQPWIEMDSGTRIVMLSITTVHIVVFFGSSFAERAPKAPKQAPKEAPAPAADPAAPKAPIVTPSGDRSTDFGRTAGRVVGSGVNALRKLTGSGENDS
jgi:hypothetical protein